MKVVVGKRGVRGQQLFLFAELVGVLDDELVLQQHCVRITRFHHRREFRCLRRVASRELGPELRGHVRQHFLALRRLLSGGLRVILRGAVEGRLELRHRLDGDAVRAQRAQCIQVMVDFVLQLLRLLVAQCGQLQRHLVVHGVAGQRRRSLPQQGGCQRQRQQGQRRGTNKKFLTDFHDCVPCAGCLCCVRQRQCAASSSIKASTQRAASSAKVFASSSSRPNP